MFISHQHWQLGAELIWNVRSHRLYHKQHSYHDSMHSYATYWVQVIIGATYIGNMSRIMCLVDIISHLTSTEVFSGLRLWWPGLFTKLPTVYESRENECQLFHRAAFKVHAAVAFSQNEAWLIKGATFYVSGTELHRSLINNTKSRTSHLSCELEITLWLPEPNGLV